jgi:hypothetical protein
MNHTKHTLKRTEIAKTNHITSDRFPLTSAGQIHLGWVCRPVRATFLRGQQPWFVRGHVAMEWILVMMVVGLAGWARGESYHAEVFDPDRRVLVVFPNNTHVNSLGMAIDSNLPTPVRQGHVVVLVHPCPGQCEDDASCFDVVEGECCDSGEEYPYWVPLTRIDAPNVTIRSRCTGTKVLIQLTKASVDDSHRRITADHGGVQIAPYRGVFEFTNAGQGGGVMDVHFDLTRTNMVDTPSYHVQRVPVLVLSAATNGFALVNVTATEEARAVFMVAPLPTGLLVNLSGLVVQDVHNEASSDPILRGGALDGLVLRGADTPATIDPSSTRVAVSCYTLEACDMPAGDIVPLDEVTGSVYADNAASGSRRSCATANTSSRTDVIVLGALFALVLVLLIGVVCSRQCRRATRTTQRALTKAHVATHEYINTNHADASSDSAPTSDDDENDDDDDQDEAISPNLKAQ